MEEFLIPQPTGKKAANLKELMEHLQEMSEPVLEYHLWTDDWKKMVANSKFKDYKWFMETAEEGYIVLQDHGDDVWFRNIMIKEL